MENILVNIILDYYLKCIVDAKLVAMNTISRKNNLKPIMSGTFKIHNILRV